MLNRFKNLIRYHLADAAQKRQIDAKRKWKAIDGDHTLRLQYLLGTDSIVVDVGGYHGQWTSDIYAMYKCRVHIFEPMPIFADFIAKRFSRNSDITLHRIALGTRDEESVFVDLDDATGRIRESSGNKNVTVPVRAAAKYLKEHNIENIDLMKINIEGDEYDLLEHLYSQNMLPSIKNIQVQFHHHVPGADKRLIVMHELLSKTHSPTYQFPYIWENWVLRK